MASYIRRAGATTEPVLANSPVLIYDFSGFYCTLVQRVALFLAEVALTLGDRR
jgi:hypothetical protein